MNQIMGTWNAKSFGNDTALDWVSELEAGQDGSLIQRTVGDPLNDIAPLAARDCEKMIAAASVIGAAATTEIKGIPLEAKQWVKEKGFVPTPKLIKLAIEALERILLDSELRDSWAEQRASEKWAKNVAQIVELLNHAEGGTLPERSPTPRPIPRSLHKLIDHPDLLTNPKIREKIRKKIANLDDVNGSSPDTDMMTPLSLVSRGGLAKETLTLIEKGADINASDIFSPSAMTCACVANHLEVAKLLIDAGAKVNFEKTIDDETGSTIDADNVPKGCIPVKLITSPALFAVAEACSPGAIDFLVESGADLNQSDQYNETLLHKAARGKNIPTLKHLIQAGVDVNKQRRQTDETALLFAITNLEIVSILLEADANPNLQDRYRGTALDIALGLPDITEALIRAGGKRSRELN